MNVSLTSELERFVQDQLNQAIDIGLQQLDNGQKIPARESFDRMKKKINKIAKEAK